VGGQWNFDADNRASFGAKGPGAVPPPTRFAPDATTQAVIALVNTRFASHPGSVAEFGWPVTRAQALLVLMGSLGQEPERISTRSVDPRGGGEVGESVLCNRCVVLLPQQVGYLGRPLGERTHAPAHDRQRELGDVASRLRGEPRAVPAMRVAGSVEPLGTLGETTPGIVGEFGQDAIARSLRALRQLRCPGGRDERIEEVEVALAAQGGACVIKRAGKLWLECRIDNVARDTRMRLGQFGGVALEPHLQHLGFARRPHRVG
jgi:hypothetical protein